MKQAYASVGETLTFELKSNPETGYTWDVVSSEGLRITDGCYDVESEDDTAGPSEKHVFKVTADAPGKYLFHAEYRRNHEDTAIDGFMVEIEFS